MPAEHANRRRAFSGLAAVVSVASSAAWVLWNFPPDRYAFYPVCPIYRYLHLQCPGCGTTRALAALIHGHFADALRDNALIVGLVLPLAVIYLGIALFRALRDREFSWPEVPQTATLILLGIAAAFTLLRNL